MYKTVWFINDGEFITEFTYYHFGKEPKFPSWYMEEGTTYGIKMIRNLKVMRTPKTFLQCLFHEYAVHSVKKNF